MIAPAPALWSINGRFLAQPQTGVQRYAGEMMRAIDAWLVADDALARRLTFEVLLPEDTDEAPNLTAIRVKQSARGRGYLWEQTILPRLASGGLINFANLAPIAHGNQILCLHDANVFLEPSSYSRRFQLAYRALLPLLARRVRAVTTVSDFSASMLGTFGITGHARPHVIHNGHEHALRWNAARSRFSAPGYFKRPFVFALGSRAKHKQLDLLLGLAPALDARGIDIVISGSTSSIFARADLKPAANVIPVGFVSDDDLAALFGQAFCFAFPSRTEGFGIPLLEAMVHGAPILSSDRASMPEVCGDAALYAPSDVPAQWLSQIERMASDPQLRDTMRAKGRLRYPHFSWHAGARAYLDLAMSLSPQRAGVVEPARGAGALRRPAA